MLDELNAIGSEDEATKWAYRRLPEKNKLNATDAKHVEEAFRAKLFSFGIYEAEGMSDDASASSGGNTIGNSPPGSIDKSVLSHTARPRIRDRDHLRFVVPGLRTSAL